MLTYSKPHLDLAAQLTLLKSRGLAVADDKAAQECLHRNGYYRLSAYWYPFRTIEPLLDNSGNPALDPRGQPRQRRTDQFLPGSTFEAARELYLFDKQFKLILLGALETVEIAVRADIALQMGALDAFAHLNPIYFRPNFVQNVNARGKTKYQEWLDKFNTSVGRSKDEFVRHYQRKYGAGAPLPIWIAIELWDFGQLSYFYSGLDTPYQVTTATRFGISNWRIMETWLQSLNYVRNLIAHHGRLWNSALVLQPAPPAQGTMPDFDVLRGNPPLNNRIYFICCVLAHFSKIVNTKTTWPQQLVDVMDSFPVIPYAGIGDMGFPANWKTHEFWK